MIAGLIIAGGRGLRMAGADKLTERLGPLPVIGHVVRALAPQVDRLAINANAAPERFEGLGLAIIADEKRFTGNPLAGLQAGLVWAAAQGAQGLLTVSGDTPFLPPDLAARLVAAAGPAAVAASAGRRHPLIGLWPLSLRPALEQFLAGGPDCRIGDWARAVGAVAVDWDNTPFDPFFNINTRADLEGARRLMEQQEWPR